jgi:pyridoxamine 5'-phosphate oxidase
VSPPDRLSHLRSDYEWGTLERVALDDDPVAQWWAWYEDAAAAGLEEPNAMSVATIADDGGPDARIVLVRGVDQRGFAFFTNYDSTKGRQLATRPLAAVTFAWLPLHRQVRVRGPVEVVSSAESDEYFASRPRASRIGAWASPQSAVIPDREALDALVAQVEQRFPDDVIPRPPRWGGFRIVPVSFEFWQGRPSRLHDRFRYRRPDSSDGGGAAWVIERLAP